MLLCAGTEQQAGQDALLYGLALVLVLQAERLVRGGLCIPSTALATVNVQAEAATQRDISTLHSHGLTSTEGRGGTCFAFSTLAFAAAFAPSLFVLGAMAAQTGSETRGGKQSDRDKRLQCSPEAAEPPAFIATGPACTLVLLSWRWGAAGCSMQRRSQSWQVSG